MLYSLLVGRSDFVAEANFVISVFLFFLDDSRSKICVGCLRILVCNTYVLQYTHMLVLM